MIKAYVNDSAISCYSDCRGQVEIYDIETDEVVWESYKTKEEMDRRVNYINSLGLNGFKELKD